MLMEMPADADQALLERARTGHGRALGQLLEAHQGQVYRFGMSMCRDPEDAKDVLQDTLLAFARSAGDLRGASSISTWLYKVARSYCIKKRRRSKFAPGRERSLDTDDAAEVELADAGNPPDETVAGKEVGQALERAIDALEPMYREVLILRDVEGLTAPEVAEVLGSSVDAVKSRLQPVLREASLRKSSRTLRFAHQVRDPRDPLGGLRTTVGSHVGQSLRKLRDTRVAGARIGIQTAFEHTVESTRQAGAE
jgi:RNA polymerase sigma factor (sigma-70 family)